AASRPTGRSVTTVDESSEVAPAAAPPQDVPPPAAKPRPPAAPASPRMVAAHRRVRAVTTRVDAFTRRAPRLIAFLRVVYYPFALALVGYFAYDAVRKIDLSTIHYLPL